MKIIKQVTPKEGEGKKIECSNCKSELEYSEHDVIAMQDKATDPLKKYVFCPVCKSRIEVQ